MGRQGPVRSVHPIPVRVGPYANFLKALIHRYGPRGTFWQTHHPKYAIRAWQIWNEPNETSLWPIQPFAKDYVALLRAAHAAIKQADGAPRSSSPGSRAPLDHVVGLPPPGLRGQGRPRLFDVAAVHPYTK